MWEMIVRLYREYAGTGMIVILFLAAIFYLIVTEKRKDIRILFVYVPLTVLALFFCPFFAELLFYFVGDEIYYRILWLLPMTPVLSYSAVKLLKSLQGKYQLWAGVGMTAIVVLCGDYIYDNIHFSRAENAYHVPQAVVEICDQIVVEGREVMVVFPVEMLQYVRQYGPTVCMPYGREITVERWYRENLLYNIMEAEWAEAEVLSNLAKYYNCHYVILKEEKELQGQLEDYDYVLEDTIDGYRIYRDTTQYLGLGEE